MSDGLPPATGRGAGGWGKLKKKVHKGDPSESLMRIPQHVAHTIAAHIRHKKTNETKMAVKSSEIKIEHMVEDFKYRRKIEIMKAQEAADLERSRAEKEASIQAARDWAEQCKEDHHKMMRRREKESRDRNEQLREEAVKMKAAVEAARESQLEEDKTKIMMLKQEFADRKAQYAAQKAVREEEEAIQTAKIMEAYATERDFVIKQRADEQVAMRVKLKTQREEALAKKQSAAAKLKAKQVREREEQAKEREKRKKLDAQRLKMQLKAQEEKKAANKAAKAKRAAEQAKFKAEQLEIARLQSIEMQQRREEEKARMFAKVKEQQEIKAAKRMKAMEEKKLAAAIAIKKKQKRDADLIIMREQQKEAKVKIKQKLDKQQAEMDAALDSQLRKAKEDAERRIALIQKLNKNG